MSPTYLLTENSATEITESSLSSNLGLETKPRRNSHSSPRPKKRTSPPKSAFTKYPSSDPPSPLKSSMSVSPLEPCLEEDPQNE